MQEADNFKTPGLVCSILSIQHSPCPAISGARRHEFPLPHRSKEARNAVDYDGLSVRQVHPSHY